MKGNYKNYKKTHFNRSYNENTDNLMGTLKESSGKSYWIESCGGDYVLKKFVQADFPGDIGIPLNVANSLTADVIATDNTTMVFFSFSHLPNIISYFLEHLLHDVLLHP